MLSRRLIKTLHTPLKTPSSLTQQGFVCPRVHALPRNAHRGLRTSVRVLSQKQTYDSEVIAETPEVKEDEKTSEIEEEVSKGLIEETEKVVGQKSQLSFQAETKKLLDIVTRSLYAEREVFVRELISNASDALEKLRQTETEGKEVSEKHLSKEIHISCDEKKATITFQDYGIGMTKEELIQNLGTIAHSGSLKYLNEMKGKANAQVDNIIGQFGVGFYSIFMVAKQVRVYSRPATQDSSNGYVWISEGAGEYELAEAEGVTRGTKIIVQLKEDSVEFSKKHIVENIIKKYSNFVSFPIILNGQRVNTVDAIWTLPKNQITLEQHKLFYQFISHAHDEPMFTIHYSTDSPLSIRSLFYIPEQHTEKFGMGRMEPGVNLYSRKVLIQPKVKGLLPEWLRFVKGVVDSEDLPLNVSREYLQDSALIKRVGTVLTRKILKSLDEESVKDPAKYNRFYKEFEMFLKEGICTDFKWKEELAKLLRYPSSQSDEGTSFDEYIKRAKPEQKEIYYVCVPGKEYVESNPFYEAFKEQNLEVLFMYNQIDEFVMGQLSTVGDKKLVSIENAKIEKKEKSKDEKPDMNSADTAGLLSWLQTTLGPKVNSVKETKLYVNAPTVIVDHEPASYRKMMRQLDPTRANMPQKYNLEINTSHSVIAKLNAIRQTNPKLASLVADQLYDNALVAAGLAEDPRSMIPRLNTILDMTLDQSNKV